MPELVQPTSVLPLTVRSLSSMHWNFESRSSYSLTAVAANAAGDSAPVVVTINISDVADVVPTLTA